nr:MAG TPA: hypothetical protein [Caudoviricetes sp.]
MLVKIKCSLSEVFFLPQIITEKGNKLRFTKGILAVGLNEQNLQKLEEFAKPYNAYIEIFSGVEAENLNDEKTVNDLNKKTKIEDEKAKLYRELENLGSDAKVSKKELVKRFDKFVDDKSGSKEDIIAQIEKNIEKIKE